MLVGAALIATVGVPALGDRISKSRVDSSADEIAYALQVAKGEAIRLAWPVVVRPDLDGQTLLGFVDSDGDLEADSGEPAVFFLALLPGGSVRFMGPTGRPGTNAKPGDSLRGLTPVGGPSGLKAAVFEVDGSVRPRPRIACLPRPTDPTGSRSAS